MALEKIKDTVYGVEGSFLIKDLKVVSQDYNNPNLSYISKSISYLYEVLTKDKKVSDVCIKGKDKNVAFFFRNEGIIAVLYNENTNFPLLRLIVDKLMSDMKGVKLEEPLFDTPLFKRIPYIKGKREEFLANIGEYAAKILTHADGKRSIAEIVKLSEETPGDVLEIVDTYKRSGYVDFR
jgi:hypothetical protein